MGAYITILLAAQMLCGFILFLIAWVLARLVQRD